MGYGMDIQGYHLVLMLGRRFHRSLWIALVMANVALTILYFQYWMPLEQGTLDKELFSRRIGTPVLEWMNGYLGTFLNLDYQGALAWMSVPVLLWWIVRPPDKAAWRRGLALLVVGAALIIGTFGGFNARYAFTLHPVLLVLLFLGGWRLLEEWKVAPRHRILFFASLVLLQLFNAGSNVVHRVHMWQLEKAKDGRAPSSGSKVDPAEGEHLSLDGWLADAGIDAEDPVLVNNLPDYWYGSKRQGIYYWCGSDQVFGAHGPEFLFTSRSDDQVAEHLIEGMDCRYILTTPDLSEYDARFMSFLQRQCSLVSRGPRLLLLYRVLPPNPPAS